MGFLKLLGVTGMAYFLCEGGEVVVSHTVTTRSSLRDPNASAANAVYKMLMFLHFWEPCSIILASVL